MLLPVSTRSNMVGALELQILTLDGLLIACGLHEARQPLEEGGLAMHT